VAGATAEGIWHGPAAQALPPAQWLKAAGRRRALGDHKRDWHGVVRAEVGAEVGPFARLDLGPGQAAGIGFAAFSAS